VNKLDLSGTVHWFELIVETLRAFKLDRQVVWTEFTDLRLGNHNIPDDPSSVNGPSVFIGIREEHQERQNLVTIATKSDKLR
jgi:hypothetical protein